MKTLVLLVVFAIVTTAAPAMIETLSTADLVSASELVVVGRVLDRKAFAVDDDEAAHAAGVQVVANLFEVTTVLKGDVAVGDRLKIRTFTGVLDFEVLTGEGEYLVFLEKTGRHYDVVNSPQGCWPVEEGHRFGGMGQEVDPAELQRQIAKAVHQAPKPEKDQR